MENNLVEIFFDQAKRFPDHTAIIHKNESISYKLLQKKVQATANYLSKKGIRKSTKVLVFIPMSIKLYQTVLALFSIGAIVVFVDEWADKRRLNKALQVVDVECIIAPRKLLWLGYILNPFRKIKTKLSIPIKLESNPFDFIKVQPEDTALITFTTGSTGLPKAANRTHQFLWQQFRILKVEIGSKPSEKCLSTLPIVLLCILGTGATAVIADFNQKKPHKLDVESMLKFLKVAQVQLLIASPFFIEKITEKKNTKLPALRKILTGGAPVFPKLAQKINMAFPKSKNMIAYGSTEAEPISIMMMEELVTKHSSMENGLAVGDIHPDIKIKIIKIADGQIELDKMGWTIWELENGEVGEIIVAGPHVLTSYFNSDEAFKLNKIKDDETIWHRTGDGGRIIDSTLFLLGRCNQFIRDVNKIISPFIIENQLSSITGVSIGTLLKANDKKWIVVEAEVGSNKNNIMEEITKLKLGQDEIHFVEQIPRDPRHFSKIEYSKILQQIS